MSYPFSGGDYQIEFKQYSFNHENDTSKVDEYRIYRFSPFKQVCYVQQRAFPFT